MPETAEQLADDLRLDKTAFSVVNLDDPDDSLDYWLAQPLSERMRGLERLRRLNYGTAAATARLQRVFEVAELEQR